MSDRLFGRDSQTGRLVAADGIGGVESPTLAVAIARTRFAPCSARIVPVHGGGRIDITPEVLLRAYAAGIFPMAEDADDPALFWVEPRERGVLPLDSFHIPRRLARTVRSDLYEIRIDADFDRVIAGCAAATPDRDRTWINGRIRRLYGELFDLGHCHTVEAYRAGRLVGGLYGVRLGAAFFGESMFHRERDASKVALVHLAARLIKGGFQLLDTQFVTGHLARFGAVEVPRRAYKQMLRDAVSGQADWYALARGRRVLGDEIMAILGEDSGAAAPRALPRSIAG